MEWIIKVSRFIEKGDIFGLPNSFGSQCTNPFLIKNGFPSMTEELNSEEWVDLCFAYEMSTANLEKLLLDYIEPFLKRIKGDFSRFHFLHHQGLDLRLYGDKQSILKEVQSVFMNFKETHPLLRGFPKENPPEIFVDPYKRPTPYLEATADFLQCTSEIIISLLIAKRSGEISHEKVFGFNIQDSKTLFPDFTHCFLNQLGAGDHYAQSIWFHNLSEMWRLSGRSFLLKEIVQLRNQVKELEDRLRQ